MGKKYEELTFDWGKLTGKDSLAIENEMAQMGIALVNPAFSSEYMVRMAAVACNEAIGSDAFDDMALPDFLKIRRKAKDFLLRAEQ